MLNSFFSVFVNAVCCWMLFDVGLYVSYLYFVYDIIIIIIILIIWVQDGNCKKMARENFSIGAFYNITKNQDNPIKTLKIQVFRGHPAPRGHTAPIF